MLAQASFHEIVDKAHSYIILNGGGGDGNGGQPAYITLRNRNLTYQFFPHFHPYVPDLIHRLNDGGASELLASDTLYLPQPNPPSGQPLQPLSVISDSTRATLLTNVPTAARPNGGPLLPLTAGTPLTLPGGTAVTVAAGKIVYQPDGSSMPLGADAHFNLPGSLPIAFSSGIQTAAEPGIIIVPDGTPVTITLQGNASAVLTADGSPVVLPANTKVAIRNGLPQPFFYFDDFKGQYSPHQDIVTQPYPVKNLDFTASGAYSIYNWELFFHVPLLIAIHLSQNQKYQAAQDWFHHIFNPSDNSPGPTPQRFWKVAPFQYNDVELIQNILTNLAQPQDPQLLKDTKNSIAAWQKKPFQPWLIARFRRTAYMLKTVMAYLDNLIAWGDSLFRQYTIETINEATQLYIMAANILGPRPQAVPKKGSVKALTYNQLRKETIDPFGNAMVDMEVDIPFDITPPAGNGVEPNGLQILRSIGKTLYFCIPRNDKLLQYWDTVADRLFKIHNSLNIQGVFQRPPLYDPRIDPALLVRATAAGVDVSSIVSGTNQPLPLVRFSFLIGKAVEICQEVKSLGAELLSAIEKGDNESLALMRSLHENAILGLTNVVKYSQWQEAAKATQALQMSLAATVNRYTYYQTLLGRTSQQIVQSLPLLDALDTSSLTKLNFSQADAAAEKTMPLDAIDPNISQDSLGVSDGEITTLSKHETEEMHKLSDARIAQIVASSLEALGSGLAIIPQFKAHAQPMGCGASVDFGGQHLHSMASGLAAISRAVAEELSFEAGKAAKLASYSRRESEWLFQSNSAKSEINQIFKQLRGAQLREAIAKREYDNHQTAMANAQQIVDFLHGNDPGPIPSSNETVTVKETTTGFYAFLKRDVKALYAKAFNLIFEVAKKAERALQHELGDPSLSYVQFNYLDGNEGLLAGEKLLFDLKTMEIAYHDLNQREYEMTKHVSLRLLDPLALLQLRSTGSCTFTMPEELFDLDGPGHFFRRGANAKPVAVTIPCVAGPYTSVNCTLALQKSSIRVSPNPGKNYQRQGSDDPRFNDYYGAVQAIVTSSAQSDSGLFDATPGERYLPFDRVGVADSRWQITLPADVKQFHFSTITDVIIHVRYTAREGGELLKAAAIQNLKAQINNARTVGSVCLFSLRHDYSSEWAKFQSTSGFSLALTPELYPYWAQDIVGANPVKGLEFFAEMSDGVATVTVSDAHGHQDTLVRNPQLGNLLAGNLVNIPKPAAVSDVAHPPLAVTCDTNAMNDLWIAITWGK